MILQYARPRVLNDSPHKYAISFYILFFIQNKDLGNRFVPMKSADEVDALYTYMTRALYRLSTSTAKNCI